MAADTQPRARPPTILSVDDDPQVLDAVVADLRSRYGDRYRVVGASSGAEAVETAERMRLRGEDLAVVVTDQRMPAMTGTEMLAALEPIHPELRSVLLTAYADIDAAISAINDVHLDHYVMKPWDPPTEHLFPVVDELLEEWSATRPATDAGLRLVGDRWSAASHRLRDFLARNLVPFRWIDVEDGDAARPLLAAVPAGTRLPLVVLEGGTTISDPTPSELAGTLGLTARPQVDFHDLVVVGAGPAGLAAGVYAGSEGLSTVVVEAEAPGGQAALSARIENYLGFPSGVSGAELARRAYAQARRFGTEILAPRRAVAIRRQDPYRVVVLEDGTELHCSSVILATGVHYRRLDVPGVHELTGAGVYYGAASTEAYAMVGGRAVVVGGANSAGQAALHLARFAAEVVIMCRSDDLDTGMSRYLVERIHATTNIVVRSAAGVTAVRGESRLEAVRMAAGDGPEEELEAAGMFVFIGAQPNTGWLEGDVVRDRDGFVVTGPVLLPDRWGLEREPLLLETSLPAVFAVGDVRARSVKRIASAVGEGSIAVQFVHEVLRRG